MYAWAPEGGWTVVIRHLHFFTLGSTPSLEIKFKIDYILSQPDLYTFSLPLYVPMG